MSLDHTTVGHPDEDELEQHWSQLYHRQPMARGYTWSRGPSDFLTDLIPRMDRCGYRSLLDLGCGDGRNLVPFAEAGFAVTGVDVSREALARARTHLASVPKAEWQLLRADVGRLALPGRYDLVVSTKLFKHLWHVETMLPFWLALVAPGGSFLFELATDTDSSLAKCRAHGRQVGHRSFALDDGTPYRFFDEGEVRQLFDGLADIEVRPVSYWDEAHGGLATRGRHRHDSWIVSGQPRSIRR